MRLDLDLRLHFLDFVLRRDGASGLMEADRQTDESHGHVELSVEDIFRDVCIISSEKGLGTSSNF